MGILQKKCRTTGKKALAYRGKGGQNTGTAFPALRLGVVRYLLRFSRANFPPIFSESLGLTPPFVSPCFRFSKPCPSFPWFLGERQGRPRKEQGFFIPTEPLKSLEKKGRRPEKTRKSSQGEKTRNSKKKQGEEGQGIEV